MLPARALVRTGLHLALRLHPQRHTLAPVRHSGCSSIAGTEDAAGALALETNKSSLGCEDAAHLQALRILNSQEPHLPVGQEQADALVAGGEGGNQIHCRGAPAAATRREGLPQMHG